ncbi:hypothetical protein CANCADRAFT_133458 [Tortispora caseinolytica NRRL Y-17796]|uniref:Uncharacterized protein n=1 Tax=Tortispora caseinolytica NRRL Y-17796 TaxID=767744 RepID=A0A1E4TBD8_9ASCO|nr:hypothetical protein CANCADRAFT_133458 [Tortispora caseinolytica NRRL Y-17796]
MFGLHKDAQDLLTIEHFRGDVSINEFIESLSAPFLDDDNGTIVDPKPYIRQFESALKNLQELERNFARRESTLQADDFQEEESYLQQLPNIADAALPAKFSSLDRLVSSAADTVSTISDTLEQLNLEHSRATNASLLLELYLDFSNNNSTTLDALRKGSSQSRCLCGKMTKDLLQLARSIGDQKVLAFIESYAEEFEKDELAQFDRAYKLNHLADMKNSADVLIAYNSGSSVISLFVNQHDFFMQNVHLFDSSTIGSDPVWSKIADPSSFSFTLDEQTTKILKDIPSVIKSESDVIDHVFEKDSEEVLCIFIRRLFDQTILQRIEVVLDHASSLSPLAYTRTLHLLHSRLKALSQTGIPDSLVGKYQNSSRINSLLQSLFKELFSTHTESGKYPSQEAANLKALLTNLFSPFVAAHQSRKSRFRFNRLGSLDESTTPTTPSTATVSTGGFFQQDISIPEVTLNISDGKLAIQWYAEAIRRTLDLVSSPKPHILELSRILLDHTSTKYIDVALTTAIDLLRSLDLRISFQAQEFGLANVIKPAIQLSRMLSFALGTVSLLSWSASSESKDQRRSAPSSGDLSAENPGSSELIKLANVASVSVQNNINGVLRQLIECTVGRVNIMLSRIKKKDYLSDDDDISNIVELASQSCSEICNVLELFHETVLNNIGSDKNSCDNKAREHKREISTASVGEKQFENDIDDIDMNVERVLSELGNGFKEALVSHIKRNSFTAAGGLLLANDTLKYQRVLGQWRVPELDDAMEFIREVAHLYIVRSEVLGPLLNRGSLQNIKSYELAEFLSRRADLDNAGVRRVLSVRSTRTRDESNNGSAIV